MLSRIAYRDRITGAPRTETARVIKVDLRADVVVFRAPDGWKYTRSLDLVDTIDGKPAA